MKKIVFFPVFLFLVSELYASTLSEGRLSELYEEAVRDASVAQKGEIVNDLIVINRDNESLVWNGDKSKLLVVTWKSTGSYEKFLKPNTLTSISEAYVVWVTSVPQVRNFCHDYILKNPDATIEDINLRLKQYLGLNFTWNYDVFVEMWVSPDDMFRPCVDPEINDSSCNLNFGKTIPIVRGIENYPDFYKNLYFQDFRSMPGVPWTGLGYTFDWGNVVTEQGAAEFILVPGAKYKIKDVYSTLDYCGK